MIALILAVTVPLQTETPSEPQAAVASQSSSQSSHPFMLIDPKSRAEDFVKAFEMLRKEKPTNRLILHTYSGQTLSNITELSVMPNGTLLMVKIFSGQGTKYQLVPVDDLQDLFYAP